MLSFSYNVAINFHASNVNPFIIAYGTLNLGKGNQILSSERNVDENR